jgi:hypothetical protein
MIRNLVSRTYAHVSRRLKRRRGKCFSNRLAVVLPIYGLSKASTAVVNISLYLPGMVSLTQCVRIKMNSASANVMTQEVINTFDSHAHSRVSRTYRLFKYVGAIRRCRTLRLWAKVVVSNHDTFNRGWPQGHL